MGLGIGVSQYELDAFAVLDDAGLFYNTVTDQRAKNNFDVSYRGSWCASTTRGKLIFQARVYNDWLVPHG